MQAGTEDEGTMAPDLGPALLADQHRLLGEDGERVPRADAPLPAWVAGSSQGTRVNRTEAWVSCSLPWSFPPTLPWGQLARPAPQLHTQLSQLTASWTPTGTP